MNAGLWKVAAVAGAAILGYLQVNLSRRLALLHREFSEFHRRIRHEQFGEREILRDRRAALMARLQEALPDGLKANMFVQGSYAMQTGVKPLSGEFDIDIGLVLERDKAEFEGPVEAKQLVRDALKQGSRRVRIRRSCVTVEYSTADHGDYHVDIAVYAAAPNGQLFLAKGKERSAPHLRMWQEAAPQDLTAKVVDKYEGAEIGQYRRCIRYMKRWKHVNFTTRAPYSIALTIAAYHWFEPRFSLIGNEPNDFEALLNLTLRMRQEFSGTRLRVLLPVAPRVDLLESMSDKQMLELQEKLVSLADALEAARDAQNIDDAIDILRGQFGEEFG